MESLLRWSIANSTPGDANREPPQPRTDLDPGIIDAILGKSDAELMKEALTIAVDEKRDEDERVQALDDFEMLIEQIDNANNLEKLKMWEPLHALLINPASSEEIRMQTLWILGTAVQNNPAAQTSYLSLSPLPTLLSFLSPSVRSSKTRSKAVYALSGLLKHNAAAVAQMAGAGGWDILRAALQDSDISVRRKVVFLLNALLVPAVAVAGEQAQQAPVAAQQPLPVSSSVTAATTSQPASGQAQSLTLHPTASTASASAPVSAPQVHSSPPSSQPVHPNSHASMMRDPASFATSAQTVAALKSSGLLPALVGALAAPVPYGPDGEAEHDTDFEEKVLRALHTYAVACRGDVDAGDRDTLARWLAAGAQREGGEAAAAEKWGLSVDEVRELRAAVA